METIEQKVRRSLAIGSWQTTRHAIEQLADRQIESWQVASGSEVGEIVEVDRSAVPNPKILIRARLANGTIVIAVWAWLDRFDRALLVTAFEPSPR